MRKKPFIALVVVLLVALVGAGSYFSYQKLFLPLQKYNHAVDLYDREDYSAALSAFSEIADYKDSMNYIYRMFQMYAGEEFVRESSHAIVYLNSYVKDSASIGLRTLLSGNSYTIDDDNPTYAKFKESYARIRELANDCKNLFTDEIVASCKDKELKTIRERFLQLVKSEYALFSQVKAEMIRKAISGESSVEADFLALKAELEGYMLAYKETFE